MPVASAFMSRARWKAFRIAAMGRYMHQGSYLSIDMHVERGD